MPNNLLITTDAAAAIAAAVAAEMKKYIEVEPTLTLEEAAKELKISITVMRQMCRERKIRAVRLEKSYRIKVRDINAWLDARTQEAETA
jgi:excisionase family DNA binding protein